jgi:hypothetical protein
LKASQSRFGFFRSGDTIAVLRDAQNSPVARDKFARRVRMGSNVTTHCLSIQVERGSNEQVALGEESRTSPTSSFTGRKLLSRLPENSGRASER